MTSHKRMPRYNTAVNGTSVDDEAAQVGVERSRAGNADVRGVGVKRKRENFIKTGLSEEWRTRREAEMLHKNRETL